MLKVKKFVACSFIATILVASTLLSPFSAATSASAATTVGKGIYKPTSIGIGTNIDVSTPDPGVATYVGRDMYIGGKPSNPSILGVENAPTGSYAVEAEGLTVVRGKLAMNPLKESWPYNGSGAGFRFGTVGFGSQFRPVVDSTVLAVAGINSEITNMSVGYNGDSPSTTTVGAWNKGAWVGQQKSSEGATPSGFAYTAQIAGPITYWRDNDERQSVVTTQGNWREGETPQDSNLFNKNAGLTDVNGKNYTNFLESEVKAKISTPLANLAATGSYTVDVAMTADNYTIKKYNNSDNRPTYGLKFDNSTKTFTRKTNYTDVNGNNASAQVKLVNNEKLITFTGNANESGNGSPLQVFNLKASDLTNSIGDTTYRGVDFSFENIPEGASVVVNIVDEKDHSATPVEFNTGWRFWWNGEEISRGYEEDGDGKTRSLYSTAAQSILWNFATASQVTIRGGMALEGNKALGGADDKWTDDDPAAAMLGSIVVPNGGFEDHVTTNGRVYVGRDFQMYNPTVAWSSFSEGSSASVIDMDQERHNFPWSGSYTPDGSAIAWSKVDAADRTTPLAGSEWAIYASENDAKENQNSIVSIVDNGMNDIDPTVGTIQFNYLNQKADPSKKISDSNLAFTYYIKEVTAPEGYQVSDKIYYATMKNAGESVNYVQGYVDENGNEVPFTPSNTTGAIANTKITGTVSWTKVEKDDAEHTPLAGSEWKLAKLGADGLTEAQPWTVSDQSASSETTWADTDAKDGKFTLAGLLPGMYTLTETQAPFGYEKNPMVYEFTVSSTDGSITWTKDKKPTFDEGGNAYISDSLTTTSVTIPVTKSVRNTDWPKDADHNYVSFNFEITAATSDPAAPMPGVTTISVAPTDASKVNDIVANFEKIAFNKDHLAEIDASNPTGAKTYTYTVKEVAPDTASAIDKLRYSKAEYQVAVTVKAKLNDAGKYSGLTTSTTVTQVKDDMGNTVSNTIGKDAASDAIPASAFTNVKVLTDLPLTGAGWTENSMLLVGAGLMLLGGIAAGAYWFATKRRQDDPSDDAGR